LSTLPNDSSPENTEEHLLGVLLSHRLYGFSRTEASIGALRLAARTRVRHMEIDTRHTQDNAIIVSHKPYLRKHTGRIRLIREAKLEELKRGEFLGHEEGIVTLEEFLDIFSSITCDVNLCVDIKDFGLEARYVDLLCKFNLVKRSWIVSWIPETLVRVHHLIPEVRLCFSHISLACHPRLYGVSKWFLCASDLFWKKTGLANKGPCFLRNLAAIKTFHNAYNEPPNRLQASPHAVGFQHAHFLPSLPQGDLGRIMSRVSGAICVPYFLINRSFVERAHHRRIEVWVFSIDTKRRLLPYMKRIGPDVVFTNNPDLIPGMKSAP